MNKKLYSHFPSNEIGFGEKKYDLGDYLVWTVAGLAITFIVVEIIRAIWFK